MKKNIAEFYTQLKKISCIDTPIGTIWKVFPVKDSKDIFITPNEDLEEAPFAIDYDIFEDEGIWEPLYSEYKLALK